MCEQRKYAIARVIVFGAFVFCCAGNLAAQVGMSTVDTSERAAVEPVDPEAVPRPSLRALRIDTPIDLNGTLDEAIWLRADSGWGFVQNLPRAGYPMSERTVVRVLYDDVNLYIGATMYDSEPARLNSPGLEQDFPTQDSDIFGVAIDTFHDRQNAFLFAVNPAGALFDAQNFNDSRYTNRAWEGVIHVSTRVHDDGWTAELAIPFTTIRFNPGQGEQTWGINFLRRVRRRGEDGYWAPLPRMYRVHKMSQAGTLTGLRGLRQGRNLQIKPYIAGSRLQGAAQAVDQLGNDADVGVDVKYGVTSRLTMDLTAFTDFSQVEVDQEQVNLTRFSLFFPELRDFFMENAGIFTVGDVTERNYRMGSSTRNFTLFHSRRIGLSADRRPIPILGGGRFSGRAGEFEIGVLNMQTREFGDPLASGYAPAENFGVFRLRRNIAGRSDIGVLFTNRQATTDGFTSRYNRTFAADANIRLFRRMVVNSYIALTDEPGISGDRYAGRVSVAWRDQIWDASGFLKHVGESFNPGVGFVQRRGMRQGYVTVGAHPQPAVRHLQEINPYVEVSAITDLGGTLESRDVRVGLGATLIDGSNINVTFTNNFERLTGVTRISGVDVAAGDYGFNEVAVTYRPTGARVLSGLLRLSRGGFFDGDRTSVTANVLFRPNYHLAITASAQHNDLTLAGTSFTADVYGARVRYAYNTRLFALAFVQFNDSSDELVANFRVNIIHAPLSDIFFVVTERRYVGDDGLRADLLERSVSVKATKLFAF
ncbi:MAG: carbohydrate binding family 9 domain-containing protein [Gemmatimonadetes bacterium]|nr:carbohydrate binding family 9 domain-containing protein [Gemmatimonadota bacterium]